MKIIITENKVEKLKSLIKNGGPRMVIQLMGGLDTFSKVLDIKGPMGFLHFSLSILHAFIARISFVDFKFL